MTILIEFNPTKAEQRLKISNYCRNYPPSSKTDNILIQTFVLSSQSRWTVRFGALQIKQMTCYLNRYFLVKHPLSIINVERLIEGHHLINDASRGMKAVEVRHAPQGAKINIICRAVY